LVRSRVSAAVLVIPAGTSAALVHGSPASLELLTDPVKFVELANVRFLVEELRQTVGQRAIDRAQRRIDRGRTRALVGERPLERRSADRRAALARTADRAQQARVDAARRVAAEGARLERELRADLRRAEAERLDDVRARLEQELAPVREFLDTLAAYRLSFESWLAAALEAAGRCGARPAPRRDPPALPASLAELSRGDDDAIATRVLGEPQEVTLPKLPLNIALPPVPAAPTLATPVLRPLPEIRLPRLLD